MQPDPYIALTEALAAVGITGQRTRPDQLIVSAQRGPMWPNQGNSFWLSYNQGLWYLSTWLPACYRVPPDILARFQLQEIDDRQYERLFPTEGEGD